MGSILSGSSDAAATQARNQQKQQQADITQATGQINQAFSGFTPQFYQNRAQAYQNYAAPQLNQQYQQASQGLYGKLANQGLLNSSAATQEKGALQQSLAQQQQGIANTGISQSQQLQQQVSQEQANLIGQANAASNPLSISGQALNTAAGFSAPSAFQPIGQAFSQFGNTYLGSQLNSTYNPQLYSYFLSGGQQAPAGGGQGLPSSQSFN